MQTNIPHQIAAAIVLLIGHVPFASACPVCNSETGEQVRAGLLDGNLALNLLAVVLPFVVLAGVTTVIHFGLPKPKFRHDNRN